MIGEATTEPSQAEPSRAGNLGWDDGRDGRDSIFIFIFIFHFSFSFIFYLRLLFALLFFAAAGDLPIKLAS
jgi:hypothetical protein